MRLNIFKWPCSAYVAVLLTVALSAVATVFVYTQTRESYHAVGFNDGQIHQREQTMRTIERIVPMEDCMKVQWASPPIELLAVKAEAFAMNIAADGSVKFCHYK